MMRISQTQDRLFSLGVLSAIQYFVRPSPLFLVGSAAIYLLYYKMRTWRNTSKLASNNFIHFTEFLSTAAKIAFTHYTLKQPLNKVIDSSTDLGRALTQLVQTAAGFSQGEFIDYDEQDYCTSLGNSMLFNICTAAARIAIFHYFEPKMEFKSLGQTFLVIFLSRSAINYLKSYVDNDDTAITKDKPYIVAMKHAAEELVDTAIVLGISSLNPSYKLELTDASGQIALNALCFSIAAVRHNIISK